MKEKIILEIQASVRREGSISRRLSRQFVDEWCFSSINGNPGIINYIETKPQSVLSFNFQLSDDDILIQNIFAVVNPEKLKLVI